MNYREIIKNNPPVPEEMQKAWITGTKAQRDSVILGYASAVLKQARKFAKNKQDIEELFQLGMEGLSRGVQKLDVNKENKIHTYLYYWIRVHMRKWEQDNRIVRLTNLAWKLLTQFRKLEEKNPDLTVDQIISLLKLSKEREFMLHRALQKCTSAGNIKTENDNSKSLDELAIKTDPELLRLEETENFNKTFNKIERKLSDKEIQYLKLKSEGLSRKEISKQLGLDFKEITKMVSTIRQFLL